MTDQLPPQVPPAVVPAADVPSAPPTPPASGVAGPPPRRSRAWIWWTLGICLGLGLLVASCVLPFAFLLSDSRDPFAGGFGDSVGVIRIDGVIAGTGSGVDGYMTPESFKDMLDQAEEDDSVKAIVLRIDSPGGTVAASEEIAAYVKACKKQIVVSVGDVGASGAYMVASQADEIWAMPGSAVGSIGVIAEIPNVSGLLDKVGVEFQVITAGKYKDAGSPYRPLTEEEQALIQGEVDDAYDQFVGIVAEGRKMSVSEVETLATGWAWNGDRAKEIGLVDKIGTYQDALDSAAKRGGIKGDYEVTPYQDDFQDLFGSVIGIASRLDKLDALMQGQESAVRRSLPR